MKLSIFIFTLITATVVYANSFIFNDVNKYYRKRLYKDIVFYEYFFYKQLKDIPEVCKNELTEYDECVYVYGVLDSENYNEICPIITGDKCQKFYNDPISFIPSCKDSDLVVKIIPTLMKYAISQNKFLCQKDEAGNLCPRSDLYIKTYYDSYEYEPSDDELKEAKLKTCQSKICREVTYEYYTSSIEKLQILNDKSLFTLKPNDEEFYKITDVNKDIIEQYIILSNFYNSTECKALSHNYNNIQNNDKNKDMTSGAFTHNIDSGLFISLGLLLLLYKIII